MWVTLVGDDVVFSAQSDVDAIGAYGGGVRTDVVEMKTVH